MRLAALLLLALAPLQAEFLQAKIEIANMDCASCVESLEMGLRRIRGVEKVTVGPENSAEFLLQPGNKLTLERLRDAIKGVGFTPKTAFVTVKGKAVTSEGKWRFEVEGIGKTYSLSAPGDATLQALRARDGQIITVRAASPLPPDPRTMPSLDVDALLEPR